MSNLFSKFNLLPSLLTTLTEKGFVKPTEIQNKAMPALLAGQSVVGVAETGSGKSLSFALPILHMMKTLENQGQVVTENGQPRVAIIVPTRELGEQLSRAIKPFTHTTRLRVRVALGGMELSVAKKNVSGPFEILVATPGRLTQLMNQDLIQLSDLRLLVLDEADQMLDQGFLPDVQMIHRFCPDECQKALFTATLSPSVEELIEKLFKEAEVIRTEGSHRLVTTLTTMNRKVLDGKRMPLLEKILSKPFSGGTLIFTNTRNQCDLLADLLKQKGLKCLIYRGEMDKVERRANLKTFREGKIGVLISTDLASRGLDVDHVERVINYHLPKDIANYIHRVGRTARAGRPGLVVNLVTERDQPLIAKIEKLNNNSNPDTVKRKALPKN